MIINSREVLQMERQRYLKNLAGQKKKIYVCAGTGCVAGGSLEIYERLKVLLEEKNIPCQLELTYEPEEERVGLKQSGCHGFCEMGPLLRIEPSDLLYLRVSVDDCEEIVERSVIGDEIIDRLIYHKDGIRYPKQNEIPFYSHQKRVVLEDCGQIDAESVEEYIAYGGYEALEKCLFDLSGEDIIKIIYDSSLRGRGGGGFPAGRKWSQVRLQKDETKYVVCNGDEGDPGAFMDRSIMEGDPHKMLEGMIIAGIASGGKEGYVYVRAEYPLAVKRLRKAIEEARKIGILGKHILGTDFTFDIKIVRGAGAFVCGEGSALTVSIEGDRGMPRVKPPRTVEQGLYGKPTLLNNVETFANVPMIIKNGADWYRSYGTEKSPGTKAFALTGNIVNTGLIEVPMGTELQKIIFDIGGGVRDGKAFKAVQIGGPSGGCLTSEHLELPLDFDSLKKVGAMIGSGGLVVMDEDTCMVEVARFFMNFTQNESCGKCVPCREGTRRMLEILERIVQGKGRMEDLNLLEELATTITATALCGLGKTAAGPVVSTLKYFREEYEAHILEKRCPAKVCQALKTIYIEADLCKGCTKCARVCPVEAIHGKVKEPFVIDQESCIKCGACIDSCNFGAIKEA